MSTCGIYEREEECMQDLVGKLEGNRLLGRPRHRWEGNIKLNIEVIKW
jgi:hypothetical protein